MQLIISHPKNFNDLAGEWIEHLIIQEDRPLLWVQPLKWGDKTGIAAHFLEGVGSIWHFVTGGVIHMETENGLSGSTKATQKIIIQLMIPDGGFPANERAIPGELLAEITKLAKIAETLKYPLINAFVVAPGTFDKVHFYLSVTDDQFTKPDL